MRRVVFRTYGGPEVLTVEQASEPEPGEGELLVDVTAIGVTLPVVRQTHGGVPLPGAPGGDVAGTVVATGPGTDGWSVGQRVTGVTFGPGYAERAVVRTMTTAAVPDDVDDLAALSVVRGGQVALGVLDAGRLADGERVLVTAAAGGVGHLLVQLARARGAGLVVGATGSAAKADFVRSLGADEAVTYDELGAERFDLAVEGAGGAALTNAVPALARFGRLVTYSAAGGSIEVNDIRAQSRSLIGFSMVPLFATRPETYAAHRAELWTLVRDGRLRPIVHTELSLADAAEAHRIIEARENLGRVILRP